MLHHHLTATENFESPNEYSKGFGMAIDAKKILRDAADCGVHLVLHGHRHRVFVWREGVYGASEFTAKKWQLGRISLLGGGNAGSTAVEGGRNYFNLITVSGKGLSVNVFGALELDSFKSDKTIYGDFKLQDGQLLLEDWREAELSKKT